MIRVLLLTFLFCSSVNATPLAEVIIVKGEVTFNEKQLERGSILKKNGLLKTGNSSIVKIRVKKWNTEIVLSQNSQMSMNFDKEAKRKYEFTKGLCRWRSLVRDINKQDKKGAIFTNQAALGVRGTDFLLISTPLFGETEIVMFEGKVEMKSLSNAKDKVLLKENQWGGIGGRFGSKIAKVLTLPKDVIQTLKKKVEMY